MSPRPVAEAGSLADLADLAALAAVVQRSAGLVIDASRRDVLTSLVRDRVATLNLSGLNAYLDRVIADGAERQNLIEGLTVGETYFARIPPQIRALRELVLPALVADGKRRLRIWSAGCSTGEEPYTLALLLAKLLPVESRAWDVRVIGTDINSRALDTAREGRYGKRSVSLLPEEDLHRFFVQDGNGWRVGDELRRLVEFRQHNLVTDPPPDQQLDLILCRNVLIYFDRPRMLEVIDAMHRSLPAGGWLLLGHSETLWRVYDGFSLVHHVDAFLYRRADGSGRQIPPGSQPARPPQARCQQPPQRAVQPPVSTTDAPAELIRTALAAKAFSMAADLATAHLEQEPLSAEIHYLLGVALVEIGDDGPALVALRRAVYLEPTLGYAQFLLGVVFGRLGHGAEAARAYGTAARSLTANPPNGRIPELGGRRIEDLAAMCRQLAAAPAVLPLNV